MDAFNIAARSVTAVRFNQQHNSGQNAAHHQERSHEYRDKLLVADHRQLLHK